MTKPIIRIHDQETNVIIDREMTDEEYQEYVSMQTAKIAQDALDAQKEITKTALLKRLGLTTEELEIILG